MSLRGYSGSAQALYRVFIAPKAIPAVIQRQAQTGSVRFQASPIQARAIYTHPKARPSSAPTSINDVARPLDEAIKSHTIFYIDAEGNKHADASLSKLLSTIDRSTTHVRQVGLTEHGIPVCKLVAKKALWLERQAKAKPKKDVKDMAKQIELNWAIDPNDLKHRLDKMAEFLREGRRVEILLAPKKRGRKASEDEQDDVLRKIKDNAETVEGAEEWKAMEGKPPGQTVLHFKANGAVAKMETSAEKGEKFDKKEQEKRERREKQEKRSLEKQEKQQKMLIDKPEQKLQKSSS